MVRHLRTRIRLKTFSSSSSSSSLRESIVSLRVSVRACEGVRVIHLARHVRQQQCSSLIVLNVNMPTNNKYQHKWDTWQKTFVFVLLLNTPVWWSISGVHCFRLRLIIVTIRKSLTITAAYRRHWRLALDHNEKMIVSIRTETVWPILSVQSC